MAISKVCESDAVVPIVCCDLGRMGYGAALARQRAVHAAVVAGEQPPSLLLVEHDPVITVSRRKGAAGHILVDRQRLAGMGIDVHDTDRGGDVTYHGPGQLVAYPILPLAPWHLNLSRYMRLLEQVVIDALAPLGVVGLRDACATGVWVRKGLSAPDTPTSDATPTACPTPFDPHLAKLAAVGVRLSRGVTLHGLALNVHPDMTHFHTIVPCGLAGRPVTSLAQILSPPPTMEQVKALLITAFQRHLVL